MLSTHFREPHQPQGRELHLTDLLTRLAADYLERKQGRENERLLLREIQHRSNNLLSVVQAISQNTFSRAKPFGQAKKAFEGRLLALAECNKLITNSMIGRIPLREIVCLQVEPFASRIALDGSASPNRLWYKALEGHFPCRTG